MLGANGKDAVGGREQGSSARRKRGTQNEKEYNGTRGEQSRLSSGGREEGALLSFYGAFAAEAQAHQCKHGISLRPSITTVCISETEPNERLLPARWVL